MSLFPGNTHLNLGVKGHSVCKLLSSDSENNNNMARE